MLGISKEFLENYMNSDLGKSITDNAVNKLEDNSFVHAYIFSPNVKRHFNITHQLAIQKIKHSFIPFSQNQQISINPLQGAQQQQKADLYIPCLSMLTFCVLACILNVEKGQFQGHILTTNYFICLGITIFEAASYKLAFSMVNSPRGMLDLISSVGYQYVVMCSISIISYWQVLVLKWSCTAYFIFINIKNLGKDLKKSSESSFKTQTVKNAIYGVHAILCLLQLKITGGL